MSDHMKLWVASLMGSFVACILLSGLYLWKVPKPLTLVKVDVQRLVKEQARWLSEQKLSAAQEEAALTHVMMRLRSVFDQQDPHTILLDAAVVLSASSAGHHRRNRSALKIRRAKMTMKRSYWCLGLFALVLLILQQTTQLVIAASESLPYGVYLVLKRSSWQVGDIVTFKGSYPQGSPVSHLTKRVRGVQGDRVRKINENLYINNNKIGRLQRHSRTGRAMKATPSGIIPKGYVFVAGDHPHSFDSRYQEFGLVKVCHIVGRSLPLW